MSEELKQFAKQFGYNYEFTIDFPEIQLTEEDTKIPSLKSFVPIKEGTITMQADKHTLEYLNLLFRFYSTKDRRKKKNIKRKIRKLKLNARKPL